MKYGYFGFLIVMAVYLAGNVLVQKKTSGETEIVLLDHGLYTQLNNKFRYDYADFWLAIINRDVDKIKAAADKLGVGELYGLFACMVTARYAALG